MGCCDSKDQNSSSAKTKLIGSELGNSSEPKAGSVNPAPSHKEKPNDSSGVPSHHKNPAQTKPEEKKPAQAGGHEGSLISRGDKLLKRAGPAEQKFYADLFDPSNVNEDLIELRKFVPTYFGTESINDQTYIILENLLTSHQHANILDCKVGKVTWTRDHNERKTADQKAKAEKTTTGSLGFRISGFVVKDDQGNTVEAIAKEEGFYSITAENIHENFRKIVGDDKKQVKRFIRQTTKLIEWFRKQRSKLFFTASVFYVLGKEGNYLTKFIDFAHVYDADGEPDNSKIYLDVIEGLENVIGVWQRLL